jgi:hypothetical protein
VSPQRRDHHFELDCTAAEDDGEWFRRQLSARGQRPETCDYAGPASLPFAMPLTDNFLTPSRQKIIKQPAKVASEMIAPR